MYLMTGEGRSVQCSKLSSATSIMASPFYKKRGMMVAATVTSGYLVKRTQTLRRWKKRWWQLTDDGVLRYFKSEKREKLLGEIE